MRRITTKPDDEWMCAQPKCARKEVLDALLRHLAIAPFNVDTIEFLGFDAKPTSPKDKLSGADREAGAPQDVVRFLHGGKSLGGGMFFQAMYMILFWPCS